LSDGSPFEWSYPPGVLCPHPADQRSICPCAKYMNVLGHFGDEPRVMRSQDGLKIPVYRESEEPPEIEPQETSPVPSTPMRTVCIIPARGGSKRIPRKNMLPFNGQPIMNYPIKAAVESGIFDLVMVSTDDEDIAEIARQAGAQVPFMRTPQASSDYAHLSMVTLEVLQMLKDRGQEFDIFCVMLPTNPFIRPEILVESLDLLNSNIRADSVMPIVPFEYPVPRGLKKMQGSDGSNYLKMVWPEYIETRSQDCETWYHDVGQFYWMRVPYFFEKQPKWMIGENTLPIEIPASQVQDIDTPEDWKLAEIKFRFNADPTICVSVQ